MGRDGPATLWGDMMRVLRHGLLCLGAATAASVLTPGCADNDMSIFVVHVQAPPQNRQNGVCLYEADPTLPKISEGSVDVLFRDSYEAQVLVGNQLIARGDSSNTRAESNRARVTGAEVTLTDANGAELGAFTALTSGTIDPAGTSAPSYGTFGITLIDRPTMERIGGGLGPRETRIVVANVKAFGQTLGGVDLESGEFAFPIRVCRGCLISFASGDDPSVAGVDCLLPQPPAGGGGATQAGCNPGQDGEPVPCQACAASLPECQRQL
jgi:hypothetical protein